ncbi:MAG TPA: HlyD family efflux transporter periplasmic adaptor subunit [Pyrinomonadaceae bacterium]|nr:HlyD family efflux transporter periplasmic adaptor subunit [Pyrinomonadaceae bacterium]
MDVPIRKSSRRNRRTHIIVYSVVGLFAISIITFGVSRLRPASPSLERSTALIETVKRGPMLRDVRGSGTLVAEDIRIIAASTAGRVERVLVQPGTEVGPGTVLLELSNSELKQSAVDAEYQLKAAEAEQKNLKVKLESERMTQQSVAATVKAEYQQARLQLDADEALAKKGVLPALSLKLSQVRTQDLASRYEIEQKRLDVLMRSAEAQVAAQQARVSQLRALLNLKNEQVNNLRVLAGTSGVLQQMTVEEGQQVAPGTNLARVVEPQHLKAELKIAETQVKDVHIGQRAQIDTRNGIIPGHVSRMDPAAQQGTFTVDVALDGALPAGARPDLTVEGTIELERLDNVVYITRPAFGQAHSTIKLFKLDPDGNNATRVQVKVGRSSVNALEVLEGLQPGDRVILSDTSALDTFDRIRLN